MKMVFIHCGGDNILPQALAYETYQKFVQAGAPDVEFIDPEVVYSSLVGQTAGITQSVHLTHTRYL